jgi:hypothetical protein
MDDLDKWTALHAVPRTARLAHRWATRHDPKVERAPKPERVRVPMEWPVGSLHARQTSILKWIESRGGKVDYR